MEGAYPHACSCFQQRGMGKGILRFLEVDKEVFSKGFSKGFFFLERFFFIEGVCKKA